MWEYSHEGKQLENKWVFRRLQKTGKVCADVMSGGHVHTNPDVNPHFTV